MEPEPSLPTFAHGKICYLEIPAVDISASAAFYHHVFGWHVRQDQQGNTSFDDTVGQVSGSWVLHRTASANPGVLISLMVDNVAATLRQIEAHGGRTEQLPTTGNAEVTAHFADPAGNVFCLYQIG